MKNASSIVRSFFEFILYKVNNSEKWFYKSLTTYKKNYFSIIHSQNFNINKYVPTLQYMLANMLNKNVDRVTLQLSADFFSFCSKHKEQSNSQFLQDLFVLYFLNKKKDGFFVEFGACDGIDMSNTLILEKKFNWRGILAEPDKYYYADLRKNRKAAASNMVVYDQAGLTIPFTHVFGDAKLSTISEYADKDSHKNTRGKGEIFDVATITLDELLTTYDAPAVIDFISVDTEGSELRILEAFSFSRKVLLWTIEHNHNQAARDKMNAIMTKQGYIPVLEGFSECDDWYIDEALYKTKIDQLMKEAVL